MNFLNWTPKKLPKIRFDEIEGKGLILFCPSCKDTNFSVFVSSTFIGGVCKCGYGFKVYSSSIFEDKMKSNVFEEKIKLNLLDIVISSNLYLLDVEGKSVSGTRWILRKKKEYIKFFNNLANKN